MESKWDRHHLAVVVLAAGLLGALFPARVLGLQTQVAAGPSAVELTSGAASSGVGLEVTAVEDSMEALRRLSFGESDLALVQEDHLRTWLNRRDRHEGGGEVVAVSRLYARPLYLLVREPLYLEQVGDLAGLRVALGPDVDAVRSLEALLDRVGLPSWRLESGDCAAVTAAGLDVKRIADCLRRGRLDAALLLGSPGDVAVGELLESGVVRLSSLDYRTVRLLREPSGSSGPFFSTSVSSPGGSGSRGQPVEIRTLAVPMLLVTRVGAEPASVATLERALRGAVRSRIAPDQTEFAVAPLARSGLPVLAGWEEERSGVREALWTALSVLPAALVVGLVLLLLLRGRSRAVRRLRQSMPLLVTLVLVPCAIVLVTLGTYLAEHRYNEHFSSPAESFWSITVYLFSGLEDRSPYTPAGKAAAAFGLLLGPVLFTVATGWVASRFIHRERKMPRNLQDHYLMLNWNLRGLQAVRQIHHPVIVEAEGTGVIVVLTDDPEAQRRLERDGMGSDPYFEDLFISLGDPTDERALLNANAQDTRSILVLADERLGEHADERTLRALFMLRKIARTQGRQDLHVVAEIVNPANQAVCDQMAEDFPGLLEYVSRGDIRSCLLAQATLHGGVVRFYKELLTVSEETNELYVLPIPEEAVGWRFRDYAALVLAAEDGPTLVPIGVQRADGVRTRMACNPRNDQGEAVLRAGDHLVVLAYEPPRVRDLPRPSRQRESA